MFDPFEVCSCGCEPTNDAHCHQNSIGVQSASTTAMALHTCGHLPRVVSGAARRRASPHGMRDDFAECDERPPRRRTTCPFTKHELDLSRDGSAFSEPKCLCYQWRIGTAWLMGEGRDGFLTCGHTPLRENEARLTACDQNTNRKLLDIRS